jgi:SAM-dependent methyltransferase
MKNSLYDKLGSLLKLSTDQSYTILDIGCGTGELLRTIGQTVDKTSRLVGIDAKPSAIATAQTQHPAGDYRTHKFEQQLPFGDEQFDLVLSIDVLECVVDKAALLQEIARVLKPQGTVVCAHWDWDTQVYASEQTGLIRQWVHAFADWQQGWMDACDGMMGRKLWGLFQRSQRFTGRIAVFTLVETNYEPGQYGYDRMQDLKKLAERGALAVADYQRLHQEMTGLAQCGAYFYSLNSYIYLGQKCT